MFRKVEPNQSLKQRLLLKLYQLDPKINLKHKLQRDLKNQNQNKNKSVDRTASSCINTKTPHIVATKDEERSMKIFFK